MTTIIRTSSQAVAEAKPIEYAACAQCINYRSGSCAFRLNSPDYITASVNRDDRACDEFNVPSTRLQPTQEPVYSNLPDSVGHENEDGSHDYRRVRNLHVITPVDLERMGVKGEHYPVIAASVYHRGETAVFILPNTKAIRVTYKTKDEEGKEQERKRTVPGQRYDVPAIYKRIVEKGVIQLHRWQRIQFDM